MTLLEFHKAKKYYREIAKDHNLPAKIQKGKWTHDQVLRWWIKYTHTKDFTQDMVRVATVQKLDAYGGVQER